MGKTRLLALALSIITVVPLAAATAQTPLVQPYGTNDGGVNVLNILPPGQGRYLNSAELLQAQSEGTQPPHNTDQLEMYSSLVQGTPGVNMDNLSTFFKDATFGVKDGEVEREYSPKEGLTILRDTGFGVPHVYGTTRSDVMFGAGYVSAEDRLFMMDTLRHVGRGRLSEFLGASEANIAMDRAAYSTSGYTEEELQAMIDRLPTLDPVRGAQAVQDVADFAAGVNQFIDEAMSDPSKMPGEYPALQQTPSEWLPTDTVAIAGLIGSQLGVGGGDELGNAAFFNALRAEGMSSKKARFIFNDLRSANDPEAPVTTTKRFNYNLDLGRVRPASIALPDVPEEPPAQQEEDQEPGVIDGPFGPIRLAFPDAMSNAILVDAKHSKSGRPIAVFGPQTGYWSPQILMELDLHGPGIDARGVGFPGISMYVLLGRGQDYAWSATSAGGDLVDTFAEKLCNPDGGEIDPESTFYMKGGECVEMYTRTDSWAAKPSAGGTPSEPAPESVQVEMTIQRTEDGIVQSRGTVDGKPVAFVSKRSSYGGEVDSALTYVDLMNGDKINDAQDFRKAFQRFNFTFNWFYVDDKTIAYQLGGKHPLRAKGTDPDFPMWGTGKWKWRGFLPNRMDPWEVAPKRGWIVSWNNKQAPGFTANDSNWAYSSVYRSQLLSDPLQKALRRGKVSLTDLVDIMGVAATTDLRGFRVLRYMLAAVGKPTDDRMAMAVDLLKEWIAAGAQRESAEPDGAYTHAAAVALMDAWWEKAIEAIFRPTLGAAFDLIPQGFDNEPSSVGSAYQGGFYGQVEKDLRRVLGKRVRGPSNFRYCGKGKVAACRSAMRASLEAAIAELEAAFGADPATWDPTEEDDRIGFAAVGIQGQESMQWQNRPTFQQVVEFRGL